MPTLPTLPNMPTNIKPFQKSITMKKSLLITLLSCLMLTAHTQQWKELTAADAKVAATQVMDAVKKVKTLDRRFEQVKRSPMTTTPTVSKGKMHYESPDVMLWSYESPYSFSMEIRGDKMTATRDGEVMKLGSKQQMGLKSMMKMIVGMSSGNSLFDDRSFDWKMAESADEYKVDMTPKNKNVKRMFSKVVLFFDKKSKDIKSLELTETDNSVTTITFLPL